MATFNVDPVHTHIDFAVRHLVISKVRGAFERFNIALDVDDATNLPTSIRVELDADSIETRVADRDAHLRSADFLHAEQHPKITFVSTKISGTPEAFTIDGDLTIRGTTKPVSLHGAFDGRMQDPWGYDRVAYTASTKINRKDFGLTWNQALEAGGFAVGDEIEISISVEAVKAKDAVPA